MTVITFNEAVFGTTKRKGNIWREKQPKRREKEIQWLREGFKTIKRGRASRPSKRAQRTAV